MKKTSLRFFAASAALILGSALAAGAGQAGASSAWADQPVTIDGLKQDWEGVPLTDWKKDAVSYALSSGTPNTRARSRARA
jgi:hypothetical protein